MPADLKVIVEQALAAGAHGDAQAAMAMFSPDVVAHYAESLRSAASTTACPPT